uniref:Alpha/beta hydrolase n=1 Tax=candidate division WOR-3 bacterium TaxID=2052148 RepID=A0A7C4GDA7_UNCW3
MSCGVAAAETPDFEIESLLKATAGIDVLVVANLGGWGRVPVEDARDLSPILGGIHSYLQSRGLRTVQTVYRRGEAGLCADISILGEAFGFHHTRARRLALELCRLREARPRLVVLLVGLSNGATFVDQVMDQFEPGDDCRILAIEIAPPFWRSTLGRANVLRLDNDGLDPLPAGELGMLIGATVGGVLRYSVERATGRILRFEEVFHVPGHDYSWPEVEAQVVGFLTSQLPKLP